MMKQKAIIYYRISESKKRDILLYQQELLTKKAIENDYNVYSQIMVCGRVCSLDFYEMKMLLNHIRANRIDAVYIYDWTRVTTGKDIYVEFEIFCNFYNVKIIYFRE